MTTFVVTTSVDVANGDVSPDDLSLREAIELANTTLGADRITFADEVDYMALADKLPTISDGLRLVGGGDVVLDANADGDAEPKTLSQSGDRRGLDIQGEGIEVTIDGIKITGGSISDGTGGGGIRSDAGSHLKIIDSLIVRNWVGGDYRPYGSGGGILAKGDCEVVGSRIQRNHAGEDGGGIAVTGDCRIEGSRFIENGAGYDGGGVSAQGDLTLRNTLVAENGGGLRGAYQSGGGIYAGEDVRMINCRIVRNEIFDKGGGVYSRGAVTARDSLIADNQAAGSYAGGFGGGIMARAVRLVDSEVSGNVVFGSAGGGIFARDVEVLSSSIVKNQAIDFRYSGNGGGICLRGGSGSVVARDSTIAWNDAKGFYGGFGGGIFAGGRNGKLDLDGVTLTGNRVADTHSDPKPLYESSGGAIAAASAEISISNSIVAGNWAQDGANAILGAPKLRSSIVGHDGRELFSDPTRIAPGVFAGNLGDNGGLTPTVALRWGHGNPAIGGADPDRSSDRDQRGVARDPHPDIGAFEATRKAGVTLTGNARPDVLQGTNARDTLDGREGDDLLRGLDGRDDLRGGAGDDTVRGNRGKDVVDGGGGSDDIFGGSNDDSLRGGAGPDRFVFYERFGVDVVEDFDARPANGQDRIDLRHLGMSATDFDERVTITDFGGATLVAVQDAGAILCRGVSGEGGKAIDLEDFLLLP